MQLPVLFPLAVQLPPLHPLDTYVHISYGNHYAWANERAILADGLLDLSDPALATSYGAFRFVPENASNTRFILGLCIIGGRGGLHGCPRCVVSVVTRRRGNSKRQGRILARGNRGMHGGVFIGEFRMIKGEGGKGSPWNQRAPQLPGGGPS